MQALRRSFVAGFTATIAFLLLASIPSTAQDQRPTIMTDGSIRTDSLPWPKIRLAELSPELVEAIFRINLGDDEAQLGMIGEIVAPAPLPLFSDQVLMLMRTPARASVQQFVQGVCRIYREFECEYDFDPELLARAYTIALEANERRNQFPDRLYLLVAERPGLSDVKALVGLDPLTGSLTELTDLSLLSDITEEMLFRTADSTLESRAMLEQRIEAREALLRKTFTIPTISYGDNFMWLYRKGEASRTFGPVVLQNGNLPHKRYWQAEGVKQAEVACLECEELGLQASLERRSRLEWNVTLDIVDRARLENALEIRTELHLPIAVSMTTDPTTSEAQEAHGLIDIALVREE